MGVMNESFGGEHLGHNTSTIKNKQPDEESCKMCSNQEEFLVKINLIIFDKSHPDFTGVYKNLHKYIDIEFAKLKINVNPESWIILLDLLGYFRH